MATECGENCYADKSHRHWRGNARQNDYQVWEETRFCHGAHKLDLSTLFTTFCLCTSLPFIFKLLVFNHTL